MFWFIFFVVLLNEITVDNSISQIYINSGSWSESGSPSNQLQQIVTDDYNYIGSASNYAVSASALKQFNWASVSVNGDRVKIITPDCNVIDKNLNEIGQEERRLLDWFASPSSKDSVPSTISINNYVSFKTTNQNLGNIRQVDNGDYSLQQVGKYRSVSSPNLRAANIEQLFIDDELVTVSHLDGSILMQPKSCPDAPMRQLISNLESELAQAEAKSEAELQAKQAERERQQKARQAELQQRLATQQAELQQRLSAQKAEREARFRERENERKARLAAREAARQEREWERQAMLAERERERAERDAERSERQRERQRGRY